MIKSDTTVRLIPCLDVRDGEVVKGINFKDLKYAGNVVELAKKYYDDGADELTFLDISASLEGRSAMIDIVKRCADEIFIPLTVGGGISKIEDVDNLLKAGADKVSVNSSAIKNPELINQITDRFGSQVLVLSVDARRYKSSNTSNAIKYEVTTHGGKIGTNIDMLKWVEEAIERGVGEILLNSMDKDGTKSGFDVEMTQDVRKICSVPLIASGGGGKKSDFTDIVKEAKVDAVLAASVFHYNKFSIKEVKEYMSNSSILIR